MVSEPEPQGPFYTDQNDLLDLIDTILELDLTEQERHRTRSRGA